MKIIDNWKQHLKAYSTLFLFANVLVSLAYGASLALGIGLTTISPMWIVVAMGVIAVMGAVGKFLKQFDTEHPDND